MKYLHDIKNKFDFFLREHFTFSRKNYFEKNEPKENLFSDKQTEEREEFLLEKFDFELFKSNSTIQNYLDNLYMLDLFDKYLKVDFKDELSVLEIGCKNWFLVKAQYFFFKKYCKTLKLTGIELDANRLYTNFYSRSEVAQFYSKDLPNTKYTAGDFLKHNGQYDYIIWILPFVFEEPLLKWGLPLSYFKPEQMLKKAYESLNEGGKVFIINQGAIEYEEQKRLCNSLNIVFEELGEVKSEFFDYTARFALIIKR